jgi:hypothetical protein
MDQHELKAGHPGSVVTRPTFRVFEHSLDALNQLQTIFDQVKSIEDSGAFPVPQDTGSLVVGEFNGNTGAFSSAVPPYILETQVLGKPHAFDIFLAAVKTVNVTLIFKLAGNPNPVTIAATSSDGVVSVTATAAPNQSQLTLDVQKSELVAWTITSGDTTISHQIGLWRNYIVGAGAFQLPALPITIVYAPPGPGSVSSYSQTVDKWTKTSVSIQQSSSTTTPQTGPQEDQVAAQFDNLMTFKSDLNAIGKLMASAPAAAFNFSSAPDTALPLGPLKDPFAGQTITPLPTPTGLKPWDDSASTAAISPDLVHTIGAALQEVASLLGSVSESLSQGTSVTSDSELTVDNKWVVGLSTAASSSQGQEYWLGDVFYYLLNAKVAWIAGPGQVTLALMGYEAIEAPSASDLLSGHSSLSPTVVGSLLDLDPFVRWRPGVPNTVVLPPLRSDQLTSRFTYWDTHDVYAGAGPVTESSQQTTTNTTATSNTSFSSDQVNETSGILAFAGIGPTTQAITTTLTQTNSQEDGQTLAVSSNFSLGPDPANNPYRVIVYFDQVFGTFAFTPPMPGPIFKGPITGSPVSNDR